MFVWGFVAGFFVSIAMYAASEMRRKKMTLPLYCLNEFSLEGGPGSMASVTLYAFWTVDRRTKFKQRWDTAHQAMGHSKNGDEWTHRGWSYWLEEHTLQMTEP